MVTITDGGEIPAVNALVPERFRKNVIGRNKKDRSQIAFSPCGPIEFPNPIGININMMPFIKGNRKSLPKELWPYDTTILSTCPLDQSERGDDMYLIVQEGYVKANDTQRRPGLHIEPTASTKPANGEFAAALEHRWGRGVAWRPDELHGRLFQYEYHECCLGCFGRSQSRCC